MASSAVNGPPRKLVQHAVLRCLPTYVTLTLVVPHLKSYDMQAYKSMMTDMTSLQCVFAMQIRISKLEKLIKIFLKKEKELEVLIKQALEVQSTINVDKTSVMY